VLEELLFMQIAMTPYGQPVVVNEVAPILIFGLAFVIALGGVYAVAVAVCGAGHINVAQVDFWRGQVKIQCK
jgi:hypothetical protein